MAYFRRRYSGARKRHTGTSRRKRVGGSSGKYSLRTAVKKVLRQVAPRETKFIDKVQTWQNLGANRGANGFHLTDIAQGDTVSTRDGAKAYIKAFKIGGEIDCSILDVATVRFKWFVITQKQTPAGAAALNASDIVANTNMPMISPLVENFKQNYRILASGQFTIDDTTTVEIKKFNKYIKFKRPLCVKYSSTTGTAATTVENCTHLYMIWDSPGSPASYPSVQYYLRTYFTD